MPRSILEKRRKQVTMHHITRKNVFFRFRVDCSLCVCWLLHHFRLLVEVIWHIRRHEARICVFIILVCWRRSQNTESRPRNVRRTCPQEVSVSFTSTYRSLRKPIYETSFRFGPRINDKYSAAASPGCPINPKPPQT